MDLNLVRVFVAVYETGNLTRAAERLYLTQPAISQALGRLRAAIADELFVRRGRVMEPTAHSREIYPTLRDALDRIDNTAMALRAFDPGTTTLRFRIALSELGETTYLAPIVAALRAAAPNAGVDAVPLEGEKVRDWLQNGEIDIAITSAPDVGPFEQATLKAEPYVVLMAAHHPLARRGLDLQRYLAAPHAVVTGDSARPALDAALVHVGGLGPPVVTLKRFAALPLLIASTDLIASVPLTVGTEWLATWPLTIADLPIDVAPVPVRLYLRAGSLSRAPTVWLRDLVLNAIRELKMPNIGMSPPPHLQTPANAVALGSPIALSGAFASHVSHQEGRA
ncbi:MAG: nodD2 3 [Naasia sp.]|nr:nodD2 3 [Naasia sp.]